VPTRCWRSAAKRRLRLSMLTERDEEPALVDDGDGYLPAVGE
jgi:hypothetical protein